MENVTVLLCTKELSVVEVSSCCVVSFVLLFLLLLYLLVTSNYFGAKRKTSQCKSRSGFIYINIHTRWPVAASLAIKRNASHGLTKVMK